MKRVSNATRLLALILMFESCLSLSQEVESKYPSQETIMQAAKDILLSAKTCALITIDEEGNPRVRMMDPFPPESDFTVWFGTNPSSRKVIQIKSNPKVTLYYLEEGNSGYVTLHGIAQIVDESSEKEKRWKEEWKEFYKNNKDDYLLIKVSPKWMEVVSYRHGIVSTASNWKPPVVIFDSNQK